MSISIFASRLARQTLIAMSAVALLSLAGCSGSGNAKNKVSGTVTLGDKDVTGEVVFVGSEKKEYTSPITEGKYIIGKIPTGEYKVLVRKLGGTGQKDGPPIPIVSAAPIKDMPVQKPTTAPPDKYAKESNGLEDVTVKGGEQTHNIELK